MSERKAEPAVLKAMMEKAEEKLHAAQREFKEGFYGEAASRAYYAVFHAICAVLAERGLSFSSHSKAIGAFNREFIRLVFFPLTQPGRFSDYLRIGRRRTMIGAFT